MKVLVVVDMQNDFITGALGSAEAQAIVERTAAHIRARQAEGYTPIATLDTHEENYLDTREGRFLPVRHCIRDTEGWRIREEIREALGDSAVLVEKPTFGSVRLPDILREMNGGEDPAAIELIGLCTDICVVSNALLIKATLPELPMAVDSACCAGVTPEKHLAALETLRSCQVAVR